MKHEQVIKHMTTYTQRIRLYQSVNLYHVTSLVPSQPIWWWL